MPEVTAPFSQVIHLQWVFFCCSNSLFTIICMFRSYANMLFFCTVHLCLLKTDVKVVMSWFIR